LEKPGFAAFLLIINKYPKAAQAFLDIANRGLG
jgi:hypothetical protein